VSPYLDFEFHVTIMFCRKRHVVDAVLNCYDIPSNEQKIVKVIRSCGNNLHEVVTPTEETFLASMPTKFRNYLWIRRGDFVVVDPIKEGGKVKGEIVQILLKEQIKYFIDQGVWPDSKEFSVPRIQKSENESSDSSELFVNTNRPYVDYPSSSEEESDEEEEEEEEDDDDVKS
ncbi:probable RNA-binding protein EIF1AD, partial [Nephila pilipes]